MPLKGTQNPIIGLICAFLPPRVSVKCPSIRKMDGRGGGDRKDKLANKACALNVLQPRPLFNWDKRNRRQVSPPRAYAKRGILAQF